MNDELLGKFVDQRDQNDEELARKVSEAISDDKMSEELHAALAVDDLLSQHFSEDRKRFDLQVAERIRQLEDSNRFQLKVHRRIESQKRRGLLVRITAIAAAVLLMVVWFRLQSAQGPAPISMPDQEWSKVYRNAETQQPYALRQIAPADENLAIAVGTAGNHRIDGRLLILGVNAQGDSLFHTELSREDAPTAGHAVCADGVGGAIAAAISNGNQLLVRVDGKGAVLWQKIEETETVDTVRSVTALGDGKFLVAGTQQVRELRPSGPEIDADTEPGYLQVFMTCMDLHGDVMWRRTVDGSSPLRRDGWVIPQVSALRDGAGGILISAISDRGVAPDAYAWFMRLDMEGDISWQRRFGDRGVHSVKGMAFSPDGGIVLSGTRDPGRTGQTNAWVLRLDASGEILWQQVFGGSKVVVSGGEIVAQPDGGFLMSMFIGSADRPAGKSHLSRLDADGNLEWVRRLGEKDWTLAWSVVRWNDSHVAICGARLKSDNPYGDARGWVTVHPDRAPTSDAAASAIEHRELPIRAESVSFLSSLDMPKFSDAELKISSVETSVEDFDLD